ncbi:hypothetical protein BDP27DRAFT_1443995 [Rhodocollybia butyracea]|uniref:Uncharacterized protein n=1 Tax=Rhodocollybia butyracea TaxID=206335 RepID=A0A9P5Q4K0_9AGAR|nr:hypothetical protein BDP27DRAFT_1443995 [Rhodocollybia butyracea]
MSTSTPSTIMPSTISSTKCNQCSANADPGFKSCTKCRSRKKQARENKALTASKNHSSKGSSAKLVAAAPTLKRKSAEEDGSMPAKKMKRHSTAGSHTTSESSRNDPMAFGFEFQTSSDLYKNLKKYARKNARINYKACHSIVADPAWDLEKRAQLVARDIRKISHISFNHKMTAAPAMQSQMFHTLRFRCTCASSTAESSEAVLKQGNQDMSKNSNPCTGEIEVTAMEDNRHSLGFPGQQIRVHIRH